MLLKDGDHNGKKYNVMKCQRCQVDKSPRAFYRLSGGRYGEICRACINKIPFKITRLMVPVNERCRKLN